MPCPAEDDVRKRGLSVYPRAGAVSFSAVFDELVPGQISPKSGSPANINKLSDSSVLDENDVSHSKVQNHCR
jgi:hypothetical protein